MWIAQPGADSLVARPRITMLPVIGSAPETGFQFGITALRMYRLGPDTGTRTSQQQAYAVYTTKSQARIQEAGRLIDELATVQGRHERRSATIDFGATERRTKRLLVVDGLSPAATPPVAQAGRGSRRRRDRVLAGVVSIR